MGPAANEETRQCFMTLVLIDPAGCWWWVGGKDPKGYGQVRLGDHVYKAHRLAYMLFRGNIPRGACVCHSCDQPGCVNPDHLFVGSASDNMLDCANKGRSHPHALDADARRRAREMLDAGVSRPEVARRFGVTKRTIYQLERRGNL